MRANHWSWVVLGTCWLTGCSAPSDSTSSSGGPSTAANNGSPSLNTDGSGSESGLDAGSTPPSWRADGSTTVPVPAADAAFVNLGDDGGCGASTLEAEQVVEQHEVVTEEEVTEVQPVALYIMLDRSASMDGDIIFRPSLWVPAKSALQTFVNDPNSGGIDVALEFFPEDFVGTCDGTGYDVPTVPVGRLPGHAGAITSALAARPTAGGIGTPIEGALRGGTRYCSNFQAQNPGQKCVLVIVTDGRPELSGCLEDTPSLVSIAEAAYAGGSGVRTFAVGLSGADFTLIDQIAQAGGAVDCDENSPRFACDISQGPDQLATALARIRDVVTTIETHTEVVTTVKDVPLDCEWAVPETDGFDKNAVNVQLTAPSWDEPFGMGQVPDAASCAGNGWYYDDPSNPQRLVACPEVCELIRGTSLARVDILLGCPTIVL